VSADSGIDSEGQRSRFNSKVDFYIFLLKYGSVHVVIAG